MKSLTKLLFSAVVLLSSISASYADTLLKEIQGQDIPFATLKGKWVLINYWAEWCNTCLAEIPALNAFHQQHKNDPVALYAVNFDGLPLSEQKDLIQRLNIHYPSLLKDPAADLNLGDINGVPITFIFNPEGRLVKTLYGGQSVKTLNQVIAKGD